MLPSDQSKDELIKAQQDSNKEAVIMHLKSEARRKVLSYAPTRKHNPEGIDILLTASEITAEAEIIYQWLIKEL